MATTAMEIKIQIKINVQMITFSNVPHDMSILLVFYRAEPGISGEAAHHHPLSPSSGFEPDRECFSAAVLLRSESAALPRNAAIRTVSKGFLALSARALRLLSRSSRGPRNAVAHGHESAQDSGMDVRLAGS